MEGISEMKKKALQCAGNKHCSSGNHNYLFQFSLVSLVLLIVFCFFSFVRLQYLEQATELRSDKKFQTCMKRMLVEKIAEILLSLACGNCLSFKMFWNEIEWYINAARFSMT